MVAREGAREAADVEDSLVRGLESPVPLGEWLDVSTGAPGYCQVLGRTCDLINIPETVVG